jgi:hypothetical protein
MCCYQSFYTTSAMSSGKRPTFGVHNPSPIKKRNVKKTSTIVVPSLQEARRAELFKKLQQLHHEKPGLNTSFAGAEPVGDDNAGYGSPMDMDDQAESGNNQDDSDNDAVHIPTDKCNDSVSPSTASMLLYQRWRDLLPTLIDPLLGYISTSLGNVATVPQGSELQSTCRSPGTCIAKTFSVSCLFVDRA